MPGTGSLTDPAHTASRWLTLRMRLLTWLHDRDWDEGASLMVVGALIGLAGGFGVVAFYGLIDLSYLVLNRWPERHVPWLGRAALRVAITATGVWLAWFIVRRARVLEGQNVPDIQLAIAKRRGVIRARPVAARTFASAVTLGSGGSVGSEGPVAVLGAGVGSALGRALRFQPRHLKILVGCGAAAGIAGAFNAPFAGAFFALEEVLGSFSIGAFSPVVMASVVGAMTVRGFLGSHPAFHMPLAADAHPVANAMLYPVLGIACGLASALYSRLDGLAPRVMRRLLHPDWLRPIVGGALTGLLVVASRGLLAGNGHLAIPQAVFGGVVWYALLGLCLAKILATVITLGSGGSGGVFTPALFIGASLGGGLGALADQLVPGHIIHPAAWALVGMAGLVSGATRAPLTAIFIVYELTNDSSYVVPLMIVSVVSYVTARRFSPYGLYDGWLAARGEHIAHGTDQALLQHLLVRDAMDTGALRVPPGTPVADVAALMARSRVSALAVVEEDGTLVGLVSHEEVHSALVQPRDALRVLVAEDLAERSEPLEPRQTLREALSRLNAERRDAIGIVERADDGRDRFVGILDRASSFAAYERELEHVV